MGSDGDRRVVITGMGAITPIGTSLEAIEAALDERRSGVSELTRIPAANLPTKIAAEATDFRGEIGDFGALDKSQTRSIRKGLKVMCREIQMGVAAAQLALLDARWTTENLNPERTGVVFGSDHITTLPEEFAEGIRVCADDEGQFQYDQWPTAGMPKLTPLWLLKYLPNMPASHIAIYNDLRGPNNSLTCREASSNLAIAEARNTIMRGNADCIVAGATGSSIHPLKTLHVVMQTELANGDQDPDKASRPFDSDRTGMVLGEGAGAVMLEEMKSAEARGARILGEVIGSGSSVAVQPNSAADLATAVANSIQMALESASLRINEVGHIHAHGLSGRHADQQEAEGIRNVFGDLADSIPVTAAKGYFGNLGAGSGAVELICSLLAIRRKRLDPVLNYEKPDPRCRLRIATGAEDPGKVVLNISFTPQGQASTIIVRA